MANLIKTLIHITSKIIMLHITIKSETYNVKTCKSVNIIITILSYHVKLVSYKVIVYIVIMWNSCLNRWTMSIIGIWHTSAIWLNELYIKFSLLDLRKKTNFAMHRNYRCHDIYNRKCRHTPCVCLVFKLIVYLPGQPCSHVGVCNSPLPPWMLSGQYRLLRMHLHRFVLLYMQCTTTTSSTFKIWDMMTTCSY